MRREYAPEMEWIPRTTDYWSESELCQYERALGFKREDLVGMTVLDLGSGPTESFSRELDAAGVHVNVVALNPDYTDRHYRRMIERVPDWQHKSVAAIAQALPFKDGVFDRVFALYSITYYTYQAIAAQKWIGEIGRVLKPGGEAILGPVYTDDVACRAFGESYQILKEFCSSCGVIAEIVTIDHSSIVIRKPS